MKRELNFRMGRGMIRERRKAFSVKSLVEAMRFVGMSELEIKKNIRDIYMKPAKEAQP